MEHGRPPPRITEPTPGAGAFGPSRRPPCSSRCASPRAAGARARTRTRICPRKVAAEQPAPRGRRPAARGPRAPCPSGRLRRSAAAAAAAAAVSQSVPVCHLPRSAAPAASMLLLLGADAAMRTDVLRDWCARLSSTDLRSGEQHPAASSFLLDDAVALVHPAAAAHVRGLGDTEPGACA